MTALAAARDTAQYGTQAYIADLYVPVAASTTIYPGGIVCLNASGYAVPASAVGNLVALGRCEDEFAVDNSAGAAGDKSVRVKRGVFWFANSATTDTITQADEGKICYLVDDQTVARTRSLGLRSPAGRVIEVDTALGVAVELGVMTNDPNVVDEFFVAAGDYSSNQYMLVGIDNAAKAALASAAGQDCIGVLQNAPAADAMAIVRMYGPTNVIASGAVAIGSRIATTNAGKSKAAVAAATDTSDAGAAADPLIGSFVLGWALTVGAADTAHRVFFCPMGAIPTTAA